MTGSVILLYIFFPVFSSYNPELLGGDRIRDLPVDFGGAMPFSKAEHYSSG